MNDVGREAFLIDVDAPLIERVPMGVEALAERGGQTNAGDPDFCDPGLEDFVSVMGDDLLRKADTLGHGIHVSAQIRMREGNVAERECRVALQFAADPDLRFGDRITRAFVNDIGVDRSVALRGSQSRASWLP